MTSDQEYLAQLCTPSPLLANLGEHDEPLTATGVMIREDNERAIQRLITEQKDSETEDKIDRYLTKGEIK